MNTTTEHIAQTTQSTNGSEQNKEKRFNNITSTRVCKARTTGGREQERVITDQLCYAMDVDQKNIKYKNITRKVTTYL